MHPAKKVKPKQGELRRTAMETAGLRLLHGGTDWNVRGETCIEQLMIQPSFFIDATNNRVEQNTLTQHNITLIIREEAETER